MQPSYTVATIHHDKRSGAKVRQHTRTVRLNPFWAILDAMATEDADTLAALTPAEMQATLGTVKKMVLVATVLAVVGYLLLVFSLTQEFTTTAQVFTEDSMKMWLKLGGVGHILIGIFIALIAIIRVLSVMPHRLGYELR